MHNVQLCPQCQKFLHRNEGTSRRDCIGPHPHHTSVSSFQAALDLPCAICSLYWAERETWTDTLPSNVECSIFSIDRFHGGQELRFGWNSPGDTHTISSLCLVPLVDAEDLESPKALDQHTGTDSTLAFLRDQYHECQYTHYICRQRSLSKEWLPTRVLDVQKLEGDTVCLVDTKEESCFGPYFTLSHCWGQSQPFSLTQSTLKQLQAGLSLNLLPATFRDAISITRRFGIRYLWIDSLCIFQDDLGDWSRQASGMREIYSLASCNIAATAAKGSDDGLFCSRNTNLLRRFPVEVDLYVVDPGLDDKSPPKHIIGTYICEVYDVWTKHVKTAPLNFRAWVNQERFLSPRVMHFSSRELFWECLQTKSSEMHPQGTPEWNLPFWFNDASSLKDAMTSFYSRWRCYPGTNEYEEHSERHSTSTHSIEVDKEALYYEWGVFRINYTQCKMTKEEDKLVAIHGVAQEVGSFLEDKLVAGLWRSRIVQELCWYTRTWINEKPLPKPTTWRAPSWSWACTNGRVWTSNTTKIHRKCGGIQLLAELEDFDVNEQVSGALCSASMRLKCTPIPAQLMIADSANGEGRSNLTFLNSGDTIEFDRFTVDALDISLDAVDPEGGTSHEVFMVPIQSCLKHDDMSEHASENTDQHRNKTSNHLEGLVLTQRSNGLEFERIGLFFASNAEDIKTVLIHTRKLTPQMATLV
ncbi:heterokaryon incompatibility protein-domain-containing protein [Lophiotrema nucula]|uniref:Heterokaryon incompatibility protein-domain-containing protein n=1 Tax=Lophiotrema nucula TaxID=690887 RepID=A0A6A5YMK7_9PLEO|nr:heterokaryon incompatibility protein-domain-containing protein [Lophiotrema nucula]